MCVSVSMHDCVYVSAGVLVCVCDCMCVWCAVAHMRWLEDNLLEPVLSFYHMEWSPGIGLRLLGAFTHWAVSPAHVEVLKLCLFFYWKCSCE